MLMELLDTSASTKDGIAHSSTEAEFTAVCDIGKMILYFRSILEDLGFEQEQATSLYEDNNGALLITLYWILHQL